MCKSLIRELKESNREKETDQKRRKEYGIKRDDRVNVVQRWQRVGVLHSFSYSPLGLELCISTYPWQYLNLALHLGSEQLLFLAYWVLSFSFLFFNV